MRAVVHDRYGDASVLRVADVPMPTISDQQVLVRVAAAGLDRGTWHLMHGTPSMVRPFIGFGGPRQPIPGRDFSGTVVAVGTAVTGFAVGDEVFGIAPGSWAQFVAASPAKLALRPAELDPAGAAALGVSGITALTAVRDKGRVTAGQRVLITGASGGVGSYAVQFAAAAGATVTAVCSAQKAEFVRGLGAAEVLDYAGDDIAAPAEPYDVIIDIAGLTPIRRLRGALTPTGTLVMVGGEGGGAVTGGIGRQMRAAARSPFLRQNLVMFVAPEARAGLVDLAAAVVDGSIRPPLDGVFGLDQAADAMRRLESGAVCGKVAIAVAD
jgi:NADPH:quinone reductase-like Zn-dependent oxidoreductase